MICNILTDNAFLGIIAVGMTFVILSGRIDLSVGSVIAFTGVFLLLVKALGNFAAGGLSAGAGDGLRLRLVYGAAD
ncbi:hypothetical protein MJ561_03285 [Klebsiella pneumoniae]|nr:hypothetical protein MJ561_03285 [Klebsiella pneumoniae]